MIGTVVRYLHDSGVPFRLLSFPTPERLPELARTLPPGAFIVEAHFVMLREEVALVCAPHKAVIEPGSLCTVFGERKSIECGVGFLHDEDGERMGPIPPLGGLFGVPLLVDERVAAHSRLVFRVFAPEDYVEMAYRDLAWLERPRVVTFAQRDSGTNSAWGAS